jgi:hypothetical protein
LAAGYGYTLKPLAEQVIEQEWQFIPK